MRNQYKINLPLHLILGDSEDLEAPEYTAHCQSLAKRWVASGSHRSRRVGGRLFRTAGNPAHRPACAPA